MERDKTISPRAVEGMIAEGQTIVIFEDLILKLDSWQHKHPGGKLVIMHMVGRDATDEIRAYVKPMALEPLNVIYDVNQYSTQRSQ